MMDKMMDKPVEIFVSYYQETGAAFLFIQGGGYENAKAVRDIRNKYSIAKTYEACIDIAEKVARQATVKGIKINIILAERVKVVAMMGRQGAKKHPVMVDKFCQDGKVKFRNASFLCSCPGTANGYSQGNCRIVSQNIDDANCKRSKK